MQRQSAAETAAAEAEQLEMQEQEWNMAELERIQEQQASLCFLNTTMRVAFHDASAV